MDEFFATGEAEIGHVISITETLGRPARAANGRSTSAAVSVASRGRSAARFESALGIDISAGMIDQARRLNARLPHV